MRPPVGLAAIEVGLQQRDGAGILPLAVGEQLEQPGETERVQGAAGELAAQHLPFQLAAAMVEPHAQAVGGHLRALLSPAAAAELAESAP